MPFEFGFDKLKEPRGFVKIVQLFVGILAFSVACNFDGTFTWSIKCISTSVVTNVSVYMAYPFYPNSSVVTLPSCTNVTVTNPSCTLPISHKVQAQFFVAVGVMSLLYCGLILMYLIVFEDEDDLINPTSTSLTGPVVDFVISIGAVAFWFVASCIFSATVTSIRTESSTSMVSASLVVCFGDLKDKIAWTPAELPRYAGLHVAAILGFLNVFVWIGNLWFIYKETPWYVVQPNHPATHLYGTAGEPTQPLVGSRNSRTDYVSSG